MWLDHQDGSGQVDICTLFPHGLWKTVKMYLTLERAQSQLAPSAVDIQDLRLNRAGARGVNWRCRAAGLPSHTLCGRWFAVLSKACLRLWDWTPCV